MHTDQTLQAALAAFGDALAAEEAAVRDLAAQLNAEQLGATVQDNTPTIIDAEGEGDTHAA